MGFYLRKSFRLGPLRVSVSNYGIGLSAGVRGARFGLDAGGHPYTHLGRHGIYYRKRWPIPTRAPRDPLALPSGPPPPETHGLVGGGWVAGVAALVRLVGWLLGSAWAGTDQADGRGACKAPERREEAASVRCQGAWL